MTAPRRPRSRAEHLLLVKMLPMCVVCHRQPREAGSARCWDCGPGRISAEPDNDPEETSDA